VQEDIGTPSLFGVFKPRILLPSVLLSLNEKQISYILLHELAHYKRRDLLANYLLLGLQVVHWFNPVIWYCFKKIRQDMEMAADEKVLAVLDGGEQKEYGRALLAVLESFNTSRLAPRLIGMVDDRKNIENRIKMISMAQFFKSKRRLFIVTGFCVLQYLQAYY
jgi:bla regulator protein BlaR1